MRSAAFNRDKLGVYFQCSSFCFSFHVTMATTDDVKKVLALDEPKLGDGTALIIASLAPAKEEPAAKGKKRKAEEEEDSSDDDEGDDNDDEASDDSGV